ncbi:hypothetical protein CLV54_1214 [Compostimonas suwonensis]|uniref:Uncharacterized protein n=2 Tax=Compostimonas suwonensis TaxID=1048394 RepID=A0A2M9BZN8_9MICO|nr:hypothetical protein CLV54_1214 [Compostimonas suwonensis]
MALCLRDLAGLADVARPSLPRVSAPPLPVVPLASIDSADAVTPALLTRIGGATGGPELAEQWNAWWERIVERERRSWLPRPRPPHFEAFDRELALQDLMLAHFDRADAWAIEQRRFYAARAAERMGSRPTDISDVIRDREHELRRRAFTFRLDLNVLPLEEPGAWIVAPNTIIVSESLRDDSASFRSWLTPVIHAIV